MQETNIQALEAFAGLGLYEDLLRGVAKMGFTDPTGVQAKVIPLLLQKGGDVVALAQTGTGKTAAFGVPIMQLCSPGGKRPQALVLCPTRELCIQVAEEIDQLCTFVKGVRATAVYGGADIRAQIDRLRRGVQILVATPGRLLDLMRRGQVDISQVRWMVLDEADEMLNMGFKEELDSILEQTPADKRTLLFSATMGADIAAIARHYMKDAIRVTIGQANVGTKNVRHIYFVVQARDRYAALKRLVDVNPDIYGLIFCRTRAETQNIADRLIQEGYVTDALHGDLNQAKRDQVMKKFRQRNIQLLVATDVAARGLDVDDLSHVINFQLPDEANIYTHRSGRTGRAGKAGISLTIVHGRELYRIRQLEKIIGRPFERHPVPTGQEVCERRLLHQMDALKRVRVMHEQIEPFMPAVMEKLADLDPDELLKRFVSLEFNRFLHDYRDAPDLNVQTRKKDREGPEYGSRKPRFFARLVLNVGGDDGVTPTRLIGHINQGAKTRKIGVGKIVIRSHSTMLEADEQHADEVIGAFDGTSINGRQVKVEIQGRRPAKGRPGDRGPSRGGRPEQGPAARRDGPAKTKNKKSKKTGEGEANRAPKKRAKN